MSSSCSLSVQDLESTPRDNSVLTRERVARTAAIELTWKLLMSYVKLMLLSLRLQGIQRVRRICGTTSCRGLSKAKCIGVWKWHKHLKRKTDRQLPWECLDRKKIVAAMIWKPERMQIALGKFFQRRRIWLRGHPLWWAYPLLGSWEGNCKEPSRFNATCFQTYSAL